MKRTDEEWFEQLSRKERLQLLRAQECGERDRERRRRETRGMTRLEGRAKQNGQ